MSLWSKIRGTTETIFQVGKGGPQLKANAGNLEARDATDAAFVIMRGATPVAANDLVTKAYADLDNAPFFATYNVDPNYAGGNNDGSPATPFATVAAAFAAALAAGVTSGVIIFAATGTSVESITFPVAGGDWEIRCDSVFGETQGALNGAIDMSGNATCRRALTNLQINGNITGVAANGATNRAVFTNIQLNSTVSLTGTGTGAWRASFVGQYPASPNTTPHRAQAAVAVTGQIHGDTYRFNSTCSFSDTSAFQNAAFASGLTSTAAGANTVTLVGCNCTAASVLTASSGSLQVIFDAYSSASFARQTTTTSGTVTQVVDQSLTSRQTLAGNSGALTVSQRYPTSLVTLTVCITLLVAGTAGTLQAAVTYTDLTGTLKTVNVGGGLLITSAAGTEVTGTLTFSQNGATAITVATTGVVTPGPLSYSLAFKEVLAA